MIELGTFKGVVFGVLSAIFFSWMTVEINHAPDLITVSDITFFRGLIGLFVLTPLIRSQLSRLTSFDARSIWLRSVYGFLSMSCFFWCVINGDVASSRAVQNSSPIFVTVFSMLLVRKANGMEILGLLLSCLGLCLLFLYTETFVRPILWWAIGISGAIFGALAFISLSISVAKFSPVLVIWAFSLISVILSIPIASTAFVSLDKSSIFYLLYLGVLSLFGQYFLSLSYKFLNVVIASSLTLTSVIMLIAYEIRYFSNTADHPLFAYCILLMGLTIIIKSREQYKVRTQEI